MMNSMPARAAAAFLLLAATACGSPRPGRVTGTAFVAQSAGNDVSLANLPVHLVQDMEKAKLDSLLSRACPFKGADAEPPTAEEVARAWAERARILNARRKQTVRTDADARFVMDSVPAGRYRVWADTVVGEDRWAWLEEVEVEGGDSAQVELSNANPDENPFRCRY